MKLYKLFMGVTAAAMFAACSSDEVAVQAPEWNADGTGYVAFSITSAENATASRGVNDNYAHGDKSEYAVKDVLLVVCDAEGTVKEAHILAGDYQGPSTTGTNVTADKLYVQKISAMEGQPYGFVIINRNGLFGISAEGKLMCGTTQVNNINKLATTLKEGLDLNAGDFTKTGILMMNAPLATKPGTSMDPTGANLSYFVNPLKVYDTEAAANIHAEGVGEVYVERAVAKVELGGEDNNTDGLAWAITGWTLDNTNKSSYLLHNVSNMTADVIKYNAENTGYRMVGDKDVQHDLPASLGTATTEHRYRTYFGLDPNMGLSAADAATAFNRVDGKTYTFSNPKYQYCAENLFDVEHQNYGNTTRALIQVKLTAPEGTVYFSKPGDNKFYTADAVKNAAQTVAAQKIAASNLWNYIVADTEDGRVVFTIAIDETTGKVNVKASGTKLEITADQAHELGYADVAAATTEYNKLMDQTLVAKDFGYNFYKEGYAYYDVRIKHFGGTYCPWNKTDDNIDTTAEAYGEDYNANAYLGRWGVLRNNWYAINITDIKNIGYADPYDLDLKPRTPGDPDDPTDPDDPDGPDPDTPDDNTPDSEKWIAVDVNVLSWAKRINDEEL